MGYSTTSSGTYTDYVPTITGFSSNPSGMVARFTLDGNRCSVYINFTSIGTSNSTAKSFTLPFAAANTIIQSFVNHGQDNGVGTMIRIATRANSNIVDLYPSATGTNWNNSGNCIFKIALTYEIV